MLRKIMLVSCTMLGLANTSQRPVVAEGLFARMATFALHPFFSEEAPLRIHLHRLSHLLLFRLVVPVRMSMLHGTAANRV